MFEDRAQAGRMIAQEFARRWNALEDTVVIGMPRGGVPVAAEIAKKYNLPLDILIVKKIGAPSNPELAIGAVSEQGECFYNTEIVDLYGINDKDLIQYTLKAQEIAKGQAKLLRAKREPLSITNKTVLLVDDGVATGASVKAAVKELRKRNVKEIIFTAPVCAREAWDELNVLVDELCILSVPIPFGAVGFFYRDFPQVTNDEVIELLKR